MLIKRPVLKKPWYQEAAEYLELDPIVIKNLQFDPAAKKFWQQKFPLFEDTVNSASRLRDKKVWIDQWRKNYGMIVAGDRIAFQRGLHEYKSLINWLLPRLSKNAKIMDYGCGTSFFCRLFSEYIPDAEYILVDIDAPSLQYAYARCRLFAKKVNVIAVDEKDMSPVLPETDFIFCRNVMEHLWYPDRVINNFYENLRKGGMLAINFAGKTGAQAHKNDAQRSYCLRDHNIITMYEKFSLIKGRHYCFVKGHFKEDGEIKIWRKLDRIQEYFIDD